MALRHAGGRTRQLFATLSQIGISYAIGGTPEQTGLRPGDRAPHATFLTAEHTGASVFTVLTGPDHHLLVLDRSQPKPQVSDAIPSVLADQAVTVHVHPISGRETLIHDAYGVTTPTMVLIRPDGYIAWRGATTDTAALGAYLAELASPT